jgi:hypothetical protein
MAAAAAKKWDGRMGGKQQWRVTLSSSRAISRYELDALATKASAICRHQRCSNINKRP